MKFKIVWIWMCMLILFPFQRAFAQEVHITEFESYEAFEKLFHQESAFYNASLHKHKTIGRYRINGKLSYITIMELNGEVVYCLDPMINAKFGDGYYEDYEYLNENTKRELWKITHHGYGNYNRYGEDYYAATQVLIWEALGYYGEALHKDLSTYHLEEKKQEIVASMHQGDQLPSFHNQTIEVPFNEAYIIEDHNRVLSSFPIQHPNLIAKQNQLSIKINQLEYQKHYQFSSNQDQLYTNIVYGKPNSQAVFLASNAKPSTSFHFQVKLITGDLKVVKVDEFQRVAKGFHQFGIYKDEQATELIKVLHTNGEDVVSLHQYLPPGTYYIKELQTSFPYLINPTIYSFEIKANELTTIQMVNQVVNVDVKIVKKDIEDQSLYLNDTYFSVKDVTDEVEESMVAASSKVLTVFKELVVEEDDIAYFNESDLYRVEGNCIIGLKDGYFDIDYDGYLMHYRVDMQATNTYTMPYPKENPILFQGATGNYYLRTLDLKNHNRPIPFVEVSFYEDEERTILIEKRVSDEYGVIKIDKFTQDVIYYQYLDYQGKFQQDKKEGYLLVEDLKWGRRYQICEIKPKEGYDLSEEVCETIEVNDVKDVEYVVTSLNRKRRVQVEIEKLDRKYHSLLDLARLQVYVNDTYLGDYYTGMLTIHGQPNTKYLVSDEINFNNSTIHTTDEQGQIILALKEGTYYYKKADDSLVYQTRVSKGIVSLADLVYGDKVKVCEVKAPSGYHLDSTCIEQVLKPSEQENTAILKLYNQKIEVDPYDPEYPIVPKMGV